MPDNTVHITTHSRLQNQVAWSNYQHQSALITGEASKPESKLALIQHEDCSLDVRLYHDATVAEVISRQGYRGIKPRYEYPTPEMYQEDEKARLNSFLGELLEFYLNKGRVKQDVLTVTRAS